jgi:hypothetical protein
MPEEARYEASGIERTQTIQLPVGRCRLTPRCIYQNVAGTYRAGKRTTLRMIVGLAAPTSGTAPRDGLPLEHGSNLSSDGFRSSRPWSSSLATDYARKDSDTGVSAAARRALAPAGRRAPRIVASPGAETSVAMRALERASRRVGLATRYNLTSRRGWGISRATDIRGRRFPATYKQHVRAQ